MLALVRPSAIVLGSFDKRSSKTKMRRILPRG